MDPSKRWTSGTIAFVVGIGLVVAGGACSDGDDGALPSECGTLAATSINGTPVPDAVVPLETSVDFYLDQEVPEMPDRLSGDRDQPELLEVQRFDDSRALVTVSSESGDHLLEIRAERINENWSVSSVSICETLRDHFGHDGGDGQRSFPTVEVMPGG